MVSFSSLIITFIAIAGSLAAPADLIKDDVVPDLASRGPSNFIIDATTSNASLARRSAINYNQDYTTGGTVNYYSSSTGFEVTWDTEDDFVVGVGWQPGSTT
jgi:endo-1,4-beta-xylanase